VRVSVKPQVAPSASVWVQTPIARGLSESELEAKSEASIVYKMGFVGLVGAVKVVTVQTVTSTWV